jgi:hypothetical protein
VLNVARDALYLGSFLPSYGESNCTFRVRWGELRSGFAAN